MSVNLLHLHAKTTEPIRMKEMTIDYTIDWILHRKMIFMVFFENRNDLRKRGQQLVLRRK